MRCVVAFLLPSVAVVQGARVANTRQSVLNDRADADDFIVLFKSGTTGETIKSWCGDACALVGNPDQGGLAFASVKGRKKLNELLSKRSAAVELVEVDEQDEAIPDLEDGDDAGISSTASWGLGQVGVGERPATGKGVSIYVQDTGVRTTHRDFGGRATPFLDFSTGDMVRCEGGLDCARDAQGHGTHCAGTAAGQSYGVASDARVFGTKTLGDSGTGQRAWNIGGIDYTTAYGFRPTVISLSLGGAGQDAAYKAAIDAATQQGVTVVVAAGNFGSPTCGYSPAFVPSAITVGATGSSGGRAPYSNTGPCNDIMAPGTHITSASHIADSMSTRMTGTSMACPHVSGGAAILLETVFIHI